MKKIILASLLLVVLSANKCADQDVETASITDKKWVLQTLNGEVPGMPVGSQAPWLQLSGDKLSGFGGCNSLMGTAAVDKGKLSFTGIGSTKKFCEGVQPVENAIKTMLGQVDSYRLTDGVLSLMGGGNELATFKGE